MPQEGGTAKRLWGFGYGGGASQARVEWMRRRVFGGVEMGKSVPMRGLRLAAGVCTCGYLRIERMNAGLAVAGGEPARISLTVLVDRQ